MANRENSVTRSLAQEFYDNEDGAVAHFQRLNPTRRRTASVLRCGTPSASRPMGV
ncbi:MAG: hypothetical protein U0531_21385 [Dehalococcoidia bacterium]